MEMSKIFYLVIVFCCFSAAGFGQYVSEGKIHVSSYVNFNINDVFARNPQATGLRISNYEGNRRIPEKFPYHPNIKILEISHCELSDLPDWSESLPNVETILIELSEFTHRENQPLKPEEQVFNILKNYKKLRKLDLVWLGFTDNLEGINQLENLEELILSCCRLPGITEEINTLNRLRSVEITAERELTLEHFNAMSKVENLEEFNYVGNDMPLEEGIYLLQQIRTLRLISNIEDSSLFNINCMPNLRNIILLISDPEEIPDSFTKAEFLRYLRITYWIRDYKEPLKKEEKEAKIEMLYEKLKDVDATIEYRIF